MDYIKELEELVSVVVDEGGSDLHISTGRVPTIRVAGSLIPLNKKRVTTKEDITQFLKQILPAKSLDLFEAQKEVDFAYSPKPGVRFRGNAFHQQGNISVALRLVPKQIKTLTELNLPPILESFTQRQQGFFLVVGPTGQGKTTTLASLIEIINQNRLEHIITIEDPIEYVFEQKKSIIDQREIRRDTPDFKSALRGVFRQDIDVLMIGEMRSPDTIATAVTAAETGHLVFSTLHTNTAAQTIDRILDSFPAEQQDQIRMQLAGSLAGIFSQRLIPRVSGGLVPAYELLINNTAVANLIRERRVHEVNTVIETSSQEGMISLNRSLVELVRSGDITIEDAYMHSSNPKVLDKML